MRLHISLALVCVTAACQAPPETSTREPLRTEAEARQELEARMAAFRSAILGGDPASIAAFFTSDALLLEPGIRVAGGDVRSFMGAFFGSGSVTALDQTALDLFVHGDVAYWILEYDETIRMQGMEPFTAMNYGFERWEKEDGVWKVDRIVAGPRNAPPEG